MTGPLSGIRIIDVTEVISGPFATMILADQGADVIKVEPPKYGDESRQLANYRNGMAALYLNCNHGKRSIGINLKTDEGLKLMYDLVRTADVFAQNWRPGAAERLKIGEPDLRKVNPNIVYASITGYGDDGPYAKRRGYDPIFQSFTGYVAAQLNPEIPIPDLVRNAVVDKASSFALAQGITAALLARERGAEGQHVKVAMLDAGLSFFWPDGMLRHSLIGEDVQNYSVPGERYQLIPTADGHIILWTSTNAQIHGSLRAVGRNDLADSPRHHGKESLEEANQIERAEALRDGLAALTTQDAYARLIEHEVAAAPVLTHAQVLEDPQLSHNGTILEATHPVYGRYRRARPAARFSSTQAPDVPPAALYGDHTDDVLTELGVSRERIDTLRRQDVIK